MGGATQSKLVSKDKSTAPNVARSAEKVTLDPRCLEAAKSGKLVVFVGAGCSCIPPTSLPSWTQIGEAVLRGLYERAVGYDGEPDIVSKDHLEMLGMCVGGHLSQCKLPPEYFSEVLVNRMGSYYFNVLSVLDSDSCNWVHNTIAHLARQGCLAAVITTNFDLCVESALRRCDVIPVSWKAAEDFMVDELIEYLDRCPVNESSARNTCLVLKVHGSADVPTTVVDTLSQRSIGLADSVGKCLAFLVKNCHWLFLGFSGADLAAAPHYLELRGNADWAVGWTWLARRKPLDAVLSLQEAFSGKGIIQIGDLSDLLDPLLEIVESRRPNSRLEILKCVGSNETTQNDATLTLTERIDQWAKCLLPEEAALSFSDLLVAVGENIRAVELLARFSEHGLANPRSNDEARVEIIRETIARAAIENSLGKHLHVNGNVAEGLEHVDRALRLLIGLVGVDADRIDLKPNKSIEVLTSENIGSWEVTLLHGRELQAKCFLDKANTVCSEQQQVVARCLMQRKSC